MAIGENQHCPTCRCEEEDLTVTIPLDYLPEGYSLEFWGSGDIIVTRPNGTYDYYWTHKLKRDTAGYTKVRMANE